MKDYISIASINRSAKLRLFLSVFASTIVAAFTTIFLFRDAYAITISGVLGGILLYLFFLFLSQVFFYSLFGHITNLMNQILW